MKITEILSEAAIAIAMKKAGKKPKGVAEGSLNEGLAHPVIVVDVQPEYSGMNDGNESSVFPQIINFVNKQTGPVLMFVNAEDQGLSGDTIQDIKQYWDDTICPEEERYTHDEETDDYIETPNCPKINWQRFAIADKGYGYFRSWMDHGIEPATIVATIRELYQQKKSDSRELQFPAFNKRTPQQSLIMGAMEEMEGDPISVNWTSVSQLKRFNGAYIVGGARDQCLREVELLMNAFNIKYKRIDSLIYEGKKGVAEGSEQECPPATQDIQLNLKNRQKAINEYGYGPLNPDMPNTKFWMKKVDEWNLDSVEEAQQSLCGNCAAFDQRTDTLDCIAQGIDSDQGEEDPTIEAGDLGYCRFLKFKCASRRTCDAWVTGGPLTDDKKEVDEGENWSKHNHKRVGGMSKKSVSVYRREHPGSKIKTAVTTKPSKLKKGSKDAKRRKSFCARMKGMKKHNTSAKTARDPNSNINKSLRRWHCESIEELHELVMLAEQFIRDNKK